MQWAIVIVFCAARLNSPDRISRGGVITMAEAGSDQNPIRGILLLVGAMFAFATMDGVSKFLVQSYSIAQMFMVRYVVFILFALWICRKIGLRQALNSNRRSLQIVRAGVLLIEGLLFVLSFRYLGLAETHAIVMTTPLIVTVLAALFLSEVVGIHRWLAVLVGFLGALIIIRPGTGAMSWYAILPLITAVTYGVMQIQTRMLSAHDRSETTILYTAIIGLPIMIVFGSYYWVWPESDILTRDLALMLLIGILAVTAHYLLILAFRYAEASVLQPYTFLLLAWAAVVGYIIFATVPDAWTVTGALIVVASGLYTFQRERRTRAGTPTAK